MSIIKIDLDAVFCRIESCESLSPVNVKSSAKELAKSFAVQPIMG